MALFNPDNTHANRPNPIFTRSGNEIPQLSLAELEEARKDQRDVRAQTARLIREMPPRKQASLAVRSVSQHLYNCVGMIFAQRRTWLEIKDILWILREDGYSKIDLAQLTTGDVALYMLNGAPAHIGLVMQVHRSQGTIVNVRMLSKWGRFGEIEHAVHDVPEYCGILDSYWSERVA